MEDDKKIKIGCMSAIIAAIIGSIIYIFVNESDKNIAEFGGQIIVALVIIGLLCVFPKIYESYEKNKTTENSERNPQKRKIGRIIAIVVSIVVALIGVSLLMNNVHISYTFGAIGIIFFAVGIGWLIYSFFKNL